MGTSGEVLTQPNGEPQVQGPPAPPPTDPAKPAKIEFTPEQQEFVNNLIAAEAGKAARKAAEDAAAQVTKDLTAKQAASVRESLKEQKRFEELNAVLEADNTTLKERVRELEDEVTRLGSSARKYEESVEQDYTEFVTGIPAVLRPFDPGPDASLDQKRAFLEMARVAQAEMGAPFQPGTPPSPPPNRQPSDDDDLVELEKLALKRSANYRRMSYG